MKATLQYFLLGLAAGLPLNLIISIMRWSSAQIHTATQGAPPVSVWSVMATQIGISLVVGFIGWRWSYLSPVRWLLGTMAVLGIPSAIIGGWLGYTRILAELMN